MNTDERSRGPSQWLPRVLKCGAATCAAGLALYLVAMNVFLETRIFRNLISFDPEHFRLEYARAYSLVPGSLHVDGLVIRGRDGSIEWILNLDRCDFRVSFFDLTRRKFHASHVRGHGLSFRVRLRVDTATPAHLAALPPVPGFAFPPYKDQGPPVAPPTDAEYKLWGVQLDDVDADPVRELWIDTIRYEGDLRVRGRWLFHPVRWLDVGPAVIDARTLAISYGARPLITDSHGVIDATVHPFDVRLPQGLEILDHVSAHVDLHGFLRTANALQILVPQEIIRFAQGQGPLDVALTVDHGVLVPAAHVTTQASDMEASAAGLALHGAVRSAFDVTRDADGAPTAVAAVTASDLVASRREGAPARAASVSLAVTSRQLKLSHAFGDAAFRLDVENAKTQSLQPWLSRPPQTDVQSGPATASGLVEGSFAEERAHGHVTFSIEKLRVSDGSTQASANLTGVVAVKEASLRGRFLALDTSHAEVRDAFARWRDGTVAARVLAVDGHGVASLSDETLSGQATIDATGVSAHRQQTEASAAMSAHLGGVYTWRDGKMNLTESEVVLKDASVRVGGADLRAPAVRVFSTGLSGANGNMLGGVAVEVPRMTIDNLAAVRQLAVLPKDVAIEQGTAAATLRLTVELPSGAASGQADVDVHALRGHLASKDLFGNLSIHLRARKDRDATVLSGSTFAFDSIVTVPAGVRDEGWWGHAELPLAELRAADGPTFHARLHLSASDASPIWALVASQTPVPRWLLATLPMNHLEMTGELLANPGTLDIRSLSAQGGSDRIELEYSSQNKRTEWALLAEAGTIGTSFHMQSGHMDFVLVNARAWYEERVATLRKSSLR